MYFSTTVHIACRIWYFRGGEKYIRWLLCYKMTCVTFTKCQILGYGVHGKATNFSEIEQPMLYIWDVYFYAIIYDFKVNIILVSYGQIFMKD